jgi:hypothetical protein
VLGSLVCAVPAGLEEMRGISEERIHMKQQVGWYAFACSCSEQGVFQARLCMLGWLVWEAAAGLEEMRGISEERIHMKQQVRCCSFIYHFLGCCQCWQLQVKPLSHSMTQQ